MRQMHEELGTNLPFAGTLIDTIPDGILILNDEQQKVVFNQHFTSLWNASESDLESADKTTILGHISLALKTSDAFLKANDLAQSLKAPYSEFFELNDDRVIEGRSSPQMTAGKATGVVWSFSDATKYKLEDQALRESDLRLRKIFETSALGILIVNLTSTIAKGDTCSAGAKVNQAFLKMLGYSQEEFDRVGVKAITHPEDWEADLSLFLDLVAGKIDHYEIEKRFYRKDGALIWVRIVVSLGEDVPGRAPFAMAILHDITKLKTLTQEREALLLAERKAKESAETALEFRDKFLAMASYELRTPLTPIKMLISILKKSVENVTTGHTRTEAMTKLTQYADCQIDRLIALVDNLLDVSRITRGLLSIRLENCNLSSLVREVAKRHTDELLKAKCTLNLQHLESIEGNWDQLRIEQVVSNLLSNAIKYGAGKPIEIITTKMNETARLTIRDHGIGILKKDQENIFNRFERVAPITNYGGLGLGLFISKQIVEAHHGKISVESKPGQGAAFIVDLPVNLEKPSHLN